MLKKKIRHQFHWKRFFPLLSWPSSVWVVGEHVFRAMFPAEFTNCLSKEFPELKGTFTHAIEIFQKLQEFLGGHQAKIHVTGHSLGGWVCYRISKEVPKENYGRPCFNAGSSPFRLFINRFVQKAWAKFTEDKVSHGEFHHHHIIGDPFTL